MREIKFRSVLEFEDGFKLMINPVTVYPDMVGFSYDLISEALEETKYTLEGDGIYWVEEDHYDKMYDLLWGEDWYWAEDVEPMQYTGLKDRTGKEIYESDILKSSDYIYLVSFSNGAFIVDTAFDFLMRYRNEVEIIGNIHENPELIK